MIFIFYVVMILSLFWDNYYVIKKSIIGSRNYVNN